ncbi:Predicted PurR-regulated permease PerM [Rhizobiales bacterium GAS188]|nr:Predicted PurR-regulated permease PerM [Rhizobiales bacterium GAS188]
MRDPIRLTSDRGLLALVGVCTVILVAAALYLARSVFAPLAFALFIIAIVWPLQRVLQARMPKLLALAVSILATIVIVTTAASMIVWGFGRVGRFIANDAPRFQLLYDQSTSWLEGHGIVVAGLWAEHFNMGWLIRLLQQVTARINSTLSFSFIVLIYVLLGLLEVDTVALKLREMKNRAAGKVLLAGSAETAAKLQKYMLVRTLMSLMTGILVWGFASLAGLQLAAEWGVIAFVLNYIPFIGPLVATVFPTLFAIAQFQSWQMAVIVFSGLNLIQFLVGSYLEPRISGRVLSISPFMVLFAVLFFSFLWGIAGAFIGVPIVIAMLTMCRQHESSRWLADLLGGPAAQVIERQVIERLEGR